MRILSVRTDRPKQAVDVTRRVEEFIRQRDFREGVCILFVAHTTACLTTGEVGEGTDADLLEVAERVIPSLRFRHAHDPSHAWSHMAASLIGPSLSLPIHEGKLALGTWQSVLLLELGGPREREISVSLLPATGGAAGTREGSTVQRS